MHDFGWLALYCVLILLASMFGGYLPLVGKISHSRLQFYLSLSAGVMLGAAVFGLTLHTFMNGVGLAGAVKARDIWMGIPGFALFMAIVLHKPADALAISTVLSRKHISRQKIFLVLFGFAAMVPIGAGAFYWIGEQ